jgi:chromosome segregation protein
MDGFKSFGKRTDLLFGNDFNVILGPNGSGKSNVLDALCFVLGKGSAKGLRAEKSGNLVYNGGKIKKQAKHGEVSIFFDNGNKVFPTEDDSVKISRIVKPDGQSIYKINDKTRTRQQVLDLLSIAKIDPNGYNIILQGDIIHFVEMSPIDRRQVIEEIAGISVYEERKEKALRELEKVDQKLNECELILKERNSQLRDLKKDRDQALKYKGLNDKIKQNKATYLKKQIDSKAKIVDDYQKKIDIKKKKLEKCQADIAKLRAEINERKEEIKKITQYVEAKGDAGQVNLQREIEKLRVDLNTNKTRISSCTNEIARIGQRKEQLQKNLAELEEKIARLNEEKQDLEKRKEDRQSQRKEVDARIEEFKKKHKLSDQENLNQQMDSFDKKADEKQAEVQALREQQQDLLRQQDRYDLEIRSLDEKINKVLAIEKEHNQELEALKHKKLEFKKATVELNEMLNKDSENAANVSDHRKQLLKFTEDLARLEAQNVHATEKAQASIAVKKILENKRKFGEVYGTVAELGNVDSRYSVAIEVAAGRKVHSIVVGDDEIAAKCIRYLKEGRFGTATFLPLNKMKSFKIDPEMKKIAEANGSHGFAIDLMEYDSKFKNVFSHILQDTIVVDSIDVARRIGIGRARMVTIDGDLAETSGAMIGGYRDKKKAGSFKGKELEIGIKKASAEIKELQKRIDLLEKGRQDDEDKISRLREFKATLEGEIIKTEKSLHLDSEDLDASKLIKEDLQNRLKGTNKSLEDINDKITITNRELAGFKIEKQKLKDQLSQLRKPTLIAELNSFEQKKKELMEDMLKLDADSKNIDVQVNEILGRDRDNSAKILKDLGKEEEGFRSEIEDIKGVIKQHEEILKEKEKKQAEFESKFKGMFDKISKFNEEINGLEAKVFEIDGRGRQEELEMNKHALEQAQVKTEFSALEAEFSQYSGVELDTAKSEEQLKKEISAFEKMQQNIGAVNMRALEIYDAVEKQYNVLLEKKGSLSKEKDDVMALMGEIEGKKKDLFMKTFDVITQNFKKIFLELSTKGDASLELENPEKPFEGGLNIKVRITGSKFLDIKSLSGGEKTMTALAFIFAIQEHEPASFYIMDEVDAALDKHNSEKLAKLIRKYCANAQYIVISHNDSLISEADHLYGVSMNEHSMSNVVSLKI